MKFFSLRIYKTKKQNENKLECQIDAYTTITFSNNFRIHPIKTKKAMDLLCFFSTIFKIAWVKKKLRKKKRNRERERETKNETRKQKKDRI